MNTRVVPFPIAHTSIQGDVMGIIKEYRDGNATVRINNSYYATKTPDQDRIDRERLSDALYNLVESLIEQGEAV
jgi:hypothetical protein